MIHVVFWDIDGTLLMTGRAGVVAWEHAVRDVLGTAADLTRFRTDGLTDVEIASTIVTDLGRSADPGCATALLRGYEARLPACLPLRAGRVLPGVRDILDALEGRPDVLSLLLTGNTEAGARAKLRHYGLDRYFSGGAFADGCDDRPSIARRALGLAGERLGAPAVPQAVTVVGDTPRDIECARAIGVRALAVASGAYSATELLAHGPWRVLEQLPEPTEFLRLVTGGG